MSGQGKSRQKFALLILLLLVLLLLSISVGAAQIPPDRIWAVLCGREKAGSFYNILVHVRLPRVAAGLLSGSALAVSGAILQATLANPLCGPSIIGVNAGAGFFVLLLAALAPAAGALAPLAAFFGALLACLIVYGLALATGASKITIVLAGVAVGSIFGAGSDAVAALFPETAAGVASFLVGGFSGISAAAVWWGSWYILVGLVAAALLAYDMNLLALGDETAATLGLRVRICRFALVSTAAALAGAAVSIGGLIGFVGLIVPHAARFLFGADCRRLVPASALLGGSFVLFCDLLARVLFAPFELPAGILMSFLGAPAFLWLLLRQRGRRNG